MILEQYYLDCLSQASYLVVDERTRAAAVVDPRRDVDLYLEEAERLDARIEHVLLTHFHADFVAGHLELRDRVGARVHLGARAGAEYAFEPLSDGDRLEFGDVRLEVLETPGHTPESVSLVVYDLAADAERPRAVFTGDTLFVGDVGRPDLMASVGVSASELAASLYDSLHGKLLALPDETLVYPAHGAGSMCGKNLGKETFSTIGQQRRLNYALQPMSREAFVALVTADQPQAPAYFGHDAQMNRREHDTLDRNLRRALRPLGLAQVLERQAAGARVLDVRDPEAFAAGHLDGSTNIGLGGRFATWAGTLLDSDAALVLVADPGREEEAATRLGRIGLDRVEGFLDGGPAAWGGHPERTATLERASADEAAARLASAAAPRVLDVRTDAEWRDGHVRDCVHVPLAQLEQRLDEVPRDRPLAVVCRSGYRSCIAASLLRRSGFTDVTDLVGGMLAWVASDLETVAPDPALR